MRLTVEPESGGQRLDRYLAQRFPGVSRALVMKYLKEGAARLNGHRARPGWYVEAGDELELADWEASLERIRAGRASGLPEAAAQTARPPADVGVIYADEDLIVVDKPAGLVMHPGKGHEEEGLDQLLRRAYGPSVRLVHRIDRDTSGVVVAARGHPRSARRLADAFKHGDVEKRYLALVDGVPDPAAGTIGAPLLVTRREGASVRVDPKGKPALTAYETVESFDRFAWLRVGIETGRRHQIRVHLAHAGHPLAVDHVYGRRTRLRVRDLRPEVAVTWKNPVVLSRQPLHAVSVALRHPRTGEDLEFEAPLPADLSAALELLRAGPQHS